MKVVKLFFVQCLYREVSVDMDLDCFWSTENNGSHRGKVSSIVLQIEIKDLEGIWQRLSRERGNLYLEFELENGVRGFCTNDCIYGLSGAKPEVLLDLYLQIYGGERISLDVKIEQLKAVVRKGTSKEIFFGEYGRVLKDIFQGSRTSDSYLMAKNSLWRSLSKEIYGEEHGGYDFIY